MRNTIFKLIMTVVAVFALYSCGGSDDDGLEKEKFAIEGGNTVTDQFTTQFTVTGLPSYSYVEWSVDNDNFSISRNSYCSALVKASKSDIKAKLSAKIVKEEKVVGVISIEICSSF